MNPDLEKAKAYLIKESCTCVLCRGEDIFSSCHRGVRPLLDFLDSAEDFTGFSAADKVVGKATAFLYCLLGVRSVHAQVLSDAAAEVFTACGIAYTCERRVKAIRNRAGTGCCPMEQATKDISDPRQALAAIRITLENLQS